MNRFFASAIFLLSSVCAYATLPNGIYLVADSAAEKFYGTRKTIEVKDGDKVVRVKDLPGPAFGDTDLSRVKYDYHLFYVSGKPHLPFAFQFFRSPRGEIRCEELLWQNAPFSFVFIFGGVPVASGTLFRDETGEQLALEASCTFSTIQASFNAWNRHLLTMAEAPRDSMFCGEKRVLYLSGLPARQELYWNGELRHMRKWFPNGQLNYSLDYISGRKMYYEREYDMQGRAVRYETGDTEYAGYHYTCWYNVDGSLLYTDSSFVTGGRVFPHQGRYACTGPPGYRRKKMYLDPLPEEDYSGHFGSETNWPHVIEQWAYENGQLVSTGRLYSKCDICDSYEVGTWTYYKNGKPERTQTFEDWQPLDAKFRREALAELQKRQKKKKK